jgi:hypothetical protein
MCRQRSGRRVEPVLSSCPHRSRRKTRHSLSFRLPEQRIAPAARQVHWIISTGRAGAATASRPRPRGAGKGPTLDGPTMGWPPPSGRIKQATALGMLILLAFIRKAPAQPPQAMRQNLNNTNHMSPATGGAFILPSIRHRPNHRQSPQPHGRPEGIRKATRQPEHPPQIAPRSARTRQPASATGGRTVVSPPDTSSARLVHWCICVPKAAPFMVARWPRGGRGTAPRRSPHGRGTVAICGGLAGGNESTAGSRSPRRTPPAAQNLRTAARRPQPTRQPGYPANRPPLDPDPPASLTRLG